MRRSFATLISLIALVGCGSRSSLEGSPLEPRDFGGSDASIDARVLPDTPDTGPAGPPKPPTPPSPPGPPPNVLPAGYVCFGEVTSVHGVSCRATSAGSADSCEASLRCNDDHEIKARCARGICECENVKFNTCYCEAPPELADPCGVGNCCWH